jgi:hypothetical protein
MGYSARIVIEVYLTKQLNTQSEYEDTALIPEQQIALYNLVHLNQTDNVVNSLIAKFECDLADQDYSVLSEDFLTKLEHQYLIRLDFEARSSDEVSYYFNTWVVYHFGKAKTHFPNLAYEFVYVGDQVDDIETRYSNNAEYRNTVTVEINSKTLTNKQRMLNEIDNLS